MLAAIGYPSLDALMADTVPADIVRPALEMTHHNKGLSETEFLAHMKELADRNVLNKNFLGLGYHGTNTPSVILRNIVENPGWYTQYTPYQAEISQGRLEMLMSFQTMICNLTGMPMANASLLDEATAAAEAMTMCSALSRGKKPVFYVSDQCHPQTIAVCRSRADGLGLRVVVGAENSFDLSSKEACGVLLQYPATNGRIDGDYKAIAEKAHAGGLRVCVAADPLALTVLEPPGSWGADIVVGSSQRFGVPMGYGGPHAAYLATSETYARLMPGRIVGLSRDSDGNPVIRLAMQTREQHIRRAKATSNICTAQALLANVAAAYAIYHGPEGLKKIAGKVHGLASVFAAGCRKMNLTVPDDGKFFDTVVVKVPDAMRTVAKGHEQGMNLRYLDRDEVTVAFDETHTLDDVDAVLAVLANCNGVTVPSAAELAPSVEPGIGRVCGQARTSPLLPHEVFNRYQSEHGMLRYLKRIENKDLSMVHSMIALGSCTMKLNSTTEMIPITWPKLSNLHPFVPPSQATGYSQMIDNLALQLAEITGFDAMSMQPNSGASGEYAGLMAIRAYHISRGDGEKRKVCLIPTSAHGTNPASAVMTGYSVVAVEVNKDGTINQEDFTAKIAKHKDELAAFMVTYPSTFGVYEEGIKGMCEQIHEAGGQVYMDGANMNAQVGLTSPGHIGADVCHLNLHKTFCIPHGGGGPGMGPIGVKAHLAPFLPSHPVVPTGAVPGAEARGAGSYNEPNAAPFGTMAAAPHGSSMILPISYAYCSMMGSEGLKRASQHAILNANYMMRRLESGNLTEAEASRSAGVSTEGPGFKVLFKGRKANCAHEFIIDCGHFKGPAEDIGAEDIAKRLMDYGFHAPTMSWLVGNTLMMEPTESESREELDRFCEALLTIRREIKEIEDGKIDPHDNPVVNAPHTSAMISADTFVSKTYTRDRAAFPLPWVRDTKFWPQTRRVDNVFGDRNLITKLDDYPKLAEAIATEKARS